METLEELLKSIDEAYSHLNDARIRLDNLLKGRFSDLALIPRLYAEYHLIAKRYNFQNDPRSSNRKQFLFVMLALYCPSSLFGSGLKKELRDIIAETFGHKSTTLIYETRDLACSWYRTYPGFKAETNIAYLEIIKSIADKRI